MVGGEGAAAKVGTPLIAGASVTAEVVAQARGPKIIVFKKQRRQNYRRKNGHRQDLTILRVTSVNA
jgi:large subunit ribosomal protein L21